MATVEQPPVRQEQSDLEELCRLAESGERGADADLLRRVRVRSAQVREEALRKFGVQEIGVQIIREFRDSA